MCGVAPPRCSLPSCGCLKTHDLQEEINEIRKLAEADGPLPPISYEHFVPMFRGLLQQVWCRLPAHVSQRNMLWASSCSCAHAQLCSTFYRRLRPGVQTMYPREKAPCYVGGFDALLVRLALAATAVGICPQRHRLE